MFRHLGRRSSAAGKVMLDTASGTADRTGYHRAVLQALGVTTH
jgi:hypothetical protein